MAEAKEDLEQLAKQLTEADAGTKSFQHNGRGGGLDKQTEVGVYCCQVI